ncbi:MAG: phage tail protein [Desulfobacterales bacterium]|nr:phage tail protein [Desulfobacterales bacterium]
MTTQNYYIILTTLGEAKVAEAIAGGTPISLTEMAVGNAEYTPSKGQTSLVNEQWRDSLNSLARDPENPNYIVAEAVIPPEDGGWDVCEVGLFDSDGNLFAIGKYPKTYKPVLAEGSGKDLYIRFIMEVSSEAEVNLLIDPAVVLATRKYVDDSLSPIETAFAFEHEQDGEHTTTFLEKLLLPLRIKGSILKYVDADEFKVSFPFTPPGAAAWTDVTLKLALAAGGGQLKAGDAVTAHEFYIVYIANTVTGQPVASDFVIREGATIAESGYTKVGIIYNSTVTNAIIRAFDMAEHGVYMWRDGFDLVSLNAGAASAWTDVDLDPAVGSTRYAPSTARQAILGNKVYSAVAPLDSAYFRKDGTSGNGRLVAMTTVADNTSYKVNEVFMELVNGVFEYMWTSGNGRLVIHVHGFVDSDGVSVSD